MKLKYTNSPLIIFIFLSSIPIFTSPFSYILKSTQKIIKTNQKRKELVAHLIAHKKTLSTQIFINTTKILLDLNEFPILNINKTTIAYAFKTLETIPGFNQVYINFLAHLNKPSSLGFLYEIECALLCINHHKNTKEKIDHLFQFNYRLPHTSLKRKDRYIDLQTSKYFIECKNVNWAYNTKRIITQLLIQKKIIKHYNKQNGTCFKHLLCSKRLIPDHIKKWLKNNKIKYREDHLACEQLLKKMNKQYKKSTKILD